MSQSKHTPDADVTETLVKARMLIRHLRGKAFTGSRLPTRDPILDACDAVDAELSAAIARARGDK